LSLKAGGNISSVRSSDSIEYVDAADSPTDSRDTSLKRRSLDTTAQAILRADLGDTHFFSVGAETTRSRTIDRRGDLLDGVSQLDTLGTRFDQRVSRPAAFAHDEWDVSKEWSADLGLRWEQMDATSTSNAGLRTGFNSTIVTPIAQTVWRIPGGEDKLRLAVSRSWRPPILSAATTVSLDNSVTRPDLAGNPFLRPEIATSFDASYEHGLPDSGSLTLALYAKKITNAIITTRTLESGRWVAMPVNAGHADVFGIEASTKFKLSTLMSTLPGAQVRFGIASNWSKVSSIPGPDNRLGSQIPLSANAGFDHIFSSMPLGWGMDAAYVRNGNVRLSQFQQSWQADQLNVDAYLRWNISRATVFRLSASNLLHRAYKFRGDYAMPGLAAQYTSTVPTYPSVRASVELRL
jgi:outer membrane receptor protein involved in Fe transport